MEMQEIIRQAESNIRQAVEDYGAHTYQMDVLEDISDEFIERLARDSSYAKQGLRELFSNGGHRSLLCGTLNWTRSSSTGRGRTTPTTDGSIIWPTGF